MNRLVTQLVGDSANHSSSVPARPALLLALALAALGAALLFISCEIEEPPPPGPPLSFDSPIDSAVFAYPPVITRSSGDIQTTSGVTSHWAGAPGSVPSDAVIDGGVTQVIVDGTVWICQEHERRVSGVNERFPLLDDNADVIWPGAALQGASLYRATPDPITAPRGPGDLIWAQINGSKLSSVHVEAMTYANVKKAADDLLGAQPTAVPADLEISIKRVRSTEDLQVAIDASASYFGLWGASASFSLASDIRFNYFLVSLKQSMFTLIFQRPGLPHQFFADGVDLRQIAPHVGPENPPAYVSRVTYGRVFYVLIRSTESADEMHGTLNANFSLGLFGTDIGSRVDYVTNLRELDVQWYVYGGSATALQNAVSGGLDQLKAFKSALEAGSDFRLAKPVFATVRSVSNDELVRNGYNSGYTYRECAPTAQCVPSLQTPPDNSKSIDNGCHCDTEPIIWTFDWDGCADSQEYELQISHKDYGVIVHSTAESRYTKRWTQRYIDERGEWAWRVRAKVDGVWGPWSATRNFTLEPTDSDCDTYVELWEHDNYRGVSKRIYMSDTSNGVIAHLNTFGMNDRVSSVRLFNIEQVTLYEHGDREGVDFSFDHDCPDVQRHNNHGFPHDKASSLWVTTCP